MCDFNVEMYSVSLFIPTGILALKNDDDRQFITEIYLEYRQLMYKVARKYFGNHTANIEDAMSEAIEQICMYVESVRGIEKNKIKNYVLRVIGNVCRKQIMAYNMQDVLKEHSVSAETIESIPDSDDPYTSVFDHSDAVALLESFVGLSEREKDLIRLRHIDQQEYSDMARSLHMSEGAVRTALARAKQHLRTLASKRESDLR